MSESTKLHTINNKNKLKIEPGGSYLTREPLDDEHQEGFITDNLGWRIVDGGYLAKVTRYIDGHCELRLYNKTRSPHYTTSTTAKNNSFAELKMRQEEIDELIDELEEAAKLEHLPTLAEELARAYREKEELERLMQIHAVKMTPEVRKAMRMLIDTGQARDEVHAFQMYMSRIRKVKDMKRHVMDLALNNTFSHFVTLTFAPSPDNQNEHGLEDEYRFEAMQKWLRKMRDRHGKFNYIVVPERHKSGEIHFHMLADLPSTVKLVQGTNPRTGKSMIRRGYKVYNLPEWTYGYTDAETIRSNNGVARYVTKYFTKDLALSPVRYGKKKYWQSSGLKAPEVTFLTEADIYELMIKEQLNLPESDYTNENMSIYDLTEKDFPGLVAKIHEKKELTPEG